MSKSFRGHVHVFKSKETIRKRSESKTVWIVAVHQPNGMTMDKMKFSTKKAADDFARPLRIKLTSRPPPG